MTRKFINNLLIFILSILTPYIGTIFFILTTNIFILLLIFLLALILLIVSGITLTNIESHKSKKKYYLIVAGLAIICYFLTYNIQRNTADLVYYKSKEVLLNELVVDIKSYKKIKEMSDGLRFWKSVNNISIEANINDVDTTDSGFGKKYFLDDVLKKNNIDKAYYELFRKKLIDTGFESFITLDDGTISFTMDGMLDNCYGIAYSETGENPETNDCGDIIRWEKISDHWYAWGTT